MATTSIRTINRLLSLAVLFISLACSQVFAQTQDARTRVQASWITTAITPEQVRYLAPLNVYQLRLEIYDAVGNRLYDSGAHFGNLLEWSWQDQQGQRLADGFYRGLVTYKDFSGQTNQRAVTLRRQGTEAALQDDERSDWLAAMPGEAARTGLVLGHDGRDARLSSGRGDLSFRNGDFFAGQDVERMRLTADGNLGLGIVRPQARLDVAGLIRTSEGIVFPDGTIQTTAARGATKSGGLDRMTDEHSLGIGGKTSGLQMLTTGAQQNGVFSDITMNATDFGGGLRLADIRLSNINAGLRFTATPGLGDPPNGAAIQFWGNASAFPGNLFLDAGALDTAALIFRTAGTGQFIRERMRVTSNGNVGIGTTSPNDRLVIGSFGDPTDNYLQIRTRGGNVRRGGIKFRVFNDSLGFTIENDERPVSLGLNILRHTTNAQGNPATFSALFIDQLNGNLGIGTTAPTSNLHVNVPSSSDPIGAMSIDVQSFNSIPNSTASHFFRVRDLGASATHFYIRGDGLVGIGTTQPADKLQVVGDLRVGIGTTGCVKDADGTVIAGTCSSDLRFKKDIAPFINVLDKLARLQPVYFNWRAAEFPNKHFGNALSYGLIAQDVEQVLPELVTKDEQGFRAVNYSKLPLLTIQAVKELRAENDALKQQNAALATRLEALEQTMQQLTGQQSVAQQTKQPSLK
jgi:FtsZ-binding cell division protein ZapB